MLFYQRLDFLLFPATGIESQRRMQFNAQKRNEAVLFALLELTFTKFLSQFICRNPFE